MRPALGALAFALALSTAAGIQAQPRFYVSGAVGGYVRDGEDVATQFYYSDDPDTRVPGRERVSFSPGVIGTVAAGYRLFPHLRVEGELGFISHHADTVRPSVTAPAFPGLTGQAFRPQDGDAYFRFTGTVNAFYDLPTLAGRYTPYLGAGVGASENHQSRGLLTDSGGAPFNVTGGSSTEGLALAEGGVAIALTDRLSLVPAYRYVRFFQSGEDRAHVAKLGLRYSF